MYQILHEFEWWLRRQPIYDLFKTPFLPALYLFIFVIWTQCHKNIYITIVEMQHVIETQAFLFHIVLYLTTLHHLNTVVKIIICQPFYCYFLENIWINVINPVCCTLVKFTFPHTDSYWYISCTTDRNCHIMIYDDFDSYPCTR